jgi:uncharacterized small protein (DUF1192 family)
MSVQFSDGSSFEFGEKAKVKKFAGVVDGTPEVKFYFSNGEKRTFLCPEELVAKAAAHGLSQKIGDSFAGVTDVEDCVAAFDEMAERLGKGEWNAEREVSGSASGASVLARAIAELTGKTLDEVKEKLKTVPAKAKVQMRSNPSLRPIIERMEAEKAKKGEPVDTDSILAQF